MLSSPLLGNIFHADVPHMAMWGAGDVDSSPPWGAKKTWVDW